MEGMDRVTEASRSSGVTGHPLWAVIGIFHVCSHSIPSQSWEVDPAVTPPFTGGGGLGESSLFMHTAHPWEVDPMSCSLAPRAGSALQPTFNLALNKPFPHLLPKLPSASDNNNHG